MPRPDGRIASQLRPLVLERSANPYAEGSCLIRMGGTLVHCTASVEPGVPGFKKGKRRGLGDGGVRHAARAPRSSGHRASGNGPGGRTQEIQRLIGRSLRAAMATMAFGEFTIRVDCDVLQADGGTRTASITGGCVALADACAWLSQRAWSALPVRHAGGRGLGGCRGRRRAARPRLSRGPRRRRGCQRGHAASERATWKCRAPVSTAAYSRAQLDRLLDLAGAGIGELFAAQKQVLGW